MPIRFACSSCGQRLSVGSHKAGLAASCPKCKATITVPAASIEADPAETAAVPAVDEPPVLYVSADRDVGSQLFDSEPEPPLLYQAATPPPRPNRRLDEPAGSIDYDRVALPRFVIFTQGILLAVVAIVCFLLGMAVGGAVTESGGGPSAEIPIVVSGTVAVAAGGNRKPDKAAVVVFLPQSAKPDEKTSLVGIRPGDDPAEGVPVRDYVRSLGGNMGVCDQRGSYSVQLPSRGRYYLLAISANATPRPNQPLNLEEVAKIGQFFDLSADPLKEFRYQWRVESLRGSGRVNVDFD